MDAIKGRSEVDRYSLGHLCLMTSALPVRLRSLHQSKQHCEAKNPHQGDSESQTFLVIEPAHMQAGKSQLYRHVRVLLMTIA